ncbi:polyamine aminopropyltransferase [Chloroflexota bacterium]
MNISSFTEKDPFAPIKYVYDVQQVLHHEKSAIQEILVLECTYFGRVLVLDGVVQLTEKDEFLYHEMLAHVALHAHPQPESILIIGGGDGGTLREVAKHTLVKRIDLVELDPRVIEVSKQFLPTVATSFDDPRLRAIHADGVKFLEQENPGYDVIIVDCTDPVGPAQALFTDSFFNNALRRLTPDGMLVAQTESLHFHRPFVADVQHRLSNIFKIADLYTASLATYAGNWWTFSIASKKNDPRTQARTCEVPTRHYADDVHTNAFLPKSLYQQLMQE